jgi:hypothetical protein
MARHIEECSAKHAGAFLTHLDRHVPAKAYAAAVRARIRATPNWAPALAKCNGCRDTVWGAEEYLRHVEGCARHRGYNATTKHHRVVEWFAALSRRVGDLVEVEPRGFQSFTCPHCGDVVKETEQRAHTRKCGGSLLRSGPDLRISGWTTSEKGPQGVFWRPHDGDMFFDVTVVHTTAPSHVGSRDCALNAKVQEKLTKYHEELKLLRVGDLTVLAVSARGRLHRDAMHFLERAANLLNCPVRELVADLSACLQHANGDILANAFGWRR